MMATASSRAVTRALVLVVATLCGGATARAQTCGPLDLTLQRSGNDLVLQSPCNGADVYRVEYHDGQPPIVTLLASAVTFPHVVANDATGGGNDVVGYSATYDGTLANTALRWNTGFPTMRDPTGRLLPNISHVGFPSVPSIADLANTAAPEANKCVGDPGGPLVPDGIENADDLLCAFWSDRIGGMDIARWNPVTLAEDVRSAFRDDVTGDVVFAGTFTAPLDPDEGLRVSVSAPDGQDAMNPAVLLGTHDPLRTPPTISGAQQRAYLPVPWHAMTVSFDEVLCGLDGVDWFDGNRDGLPDSCPGGLFDSDNAMAVVHFVQDFFAVGYVARVAQDTVFGLRFTGRNETIRRGEALVVWMTPDHAPVSYAFPHY